VKHSARMTKQMELKNDAELNFADAEFWFYALFVFEDLKLLCWNS